MYLYVPAVEAAARIGFMVWRWDKRENSGSQTEQEIGA
jgi:hypothetical protein